MKNIEDIINYWCKVISEEIAERKFYNKKEIEAYAKVKLKFTISECLKIQMNDLEIERNKLAIKNNSNQLSVKEKDRLIELNFKIKEHNRYLNKEKNNEDFFKLKNYLNKIHGKGYIGEIFEEINKNSVIS